MPKIEKITALEILDSRGNPTVSATVFLDDGSFGKAAVPSGASTGRHEAWELRDGDPKRYFGLGVKKAVANIEEKIFPKLKKIDIFDQEKIDQTMIELDGTKNKKKLGANAILAVSLACARAAAQAADKSLYVYLASIFGYKNKFSLPTPCFNIFNGGKHADTNLDFQEFWIIPLANLAGKKKQKFSRQLQMGSEIFHELAYVLHQAGFDTDVGNEGGYAPDIISSIQALELIMAAIVNVGYKPGKDVGLGIDVGSSELYNSRTKKYVFRLDQAQFSSTDLLGLYHEWLNKFPLIAIEDGLAEDDWVGWRKLTRELGNQLLLIGDDLFVTNQARLRRGLKEKVANAILIKPNQVGSLTETFECVRLAQKHNYKIVVSHRSGETCDNFIADLAVAIGAEFIKSGSLSRSERLSKYNRLLEIEREIEGEIES